MVSKHLIKLKIRFPLLSLSINSNIFSASLKKSKMKLENNGLSDFNKFPIADKNGPTKTLFQHCIFYVLN